LETIAIQARCVTETRWAGIRRFGTIFRMDIENDFRNPVLVGYNTVLAVLLILIMGSLVGGLFADQSDAFAYYTITFCVFGMLMTCTTAANSFMERDIRRPNLRIIHSPAGAFPIHFSKTLASATFGYICHVGLLLVVCPLLGMSLGESPLLFVALMAPVELASAALGTFFCCVFRCEETTNMLLSTVVELMSVLGGTFFSLDGMGDIIAGLSAASPVRWLDDAFFRLAFDGDAALVMPVFLGAVAVAALFVAGSCLLFKTEDYL
jgi:ABC-2 type transport system permease protein